MAIIQNWDKSKLQDYLLFGSWQPYNAWRVLAGLDYFTGEGEFDSALADDQLSFDSSDYFSDINKMQEDVDRLRVFWNSDLRRETPDAPSFFIEWALTKRYRPAWLDWAIKHGLYTSKQEAAETTQPAAPLYSTPWLTIQQAAIAQFFNPRRNPDAKRDEVVEWIKQQAEIAGLPDSNNVATTIFTIIKPANHDPKKKRVEPLE